MRMRTDHGLYACDLVVRCQFANVDSLVYSSSDSVVAAKTPAFQCSYSPCQAYRHLGTVLPCPRDACRPLRTLLSTARSHASNQTNPPPPIPPFPVSLSRLVLRLYVRLRMHARRCRVTGVIFRPATPFTGGDIIRAAHSPLHARAGTSWEPVPEISGRALASPGQPCPLVTLPVTAPSRCRWLRRWSGHGA